MFKAECIILIYLYFSFLYKMIIWFCSDHNTVSGGLVAEYIALKEYNGSIVVIPGMEYTQVFF